MKHQPARALLLALTIAPPAMTVAASPAAKPVIRLGVIAEQANEPDRMLRVYADLLAELRARLSPRGISVAPLVIARDLPDLSHRLERAEVDLVAETVFVTLDLQQESRLSLSPELAIVRRDQREYHSVFFASKNSKVKTLGDLRGKTLVLQAERSTSAFAVPKAELARLGISVVPAGQPGAPKGSAYYLLAGAELNQAIWVLKDKGDAGAFNEGDWSRLPQKVRDGLVIFHQTRPLLRGLVSFRAGLDRQTRRECEEVLLSLHQSAAGQAALAQAAGITRFERLTAKDLAGLKEWKSALKGAARH
jgi:phosphonate transport system substrate-binding protein